MLAWGAAFAFAFAAVSAADTTAATWMSWPVLACTGMVLLALDQAINRRGRNSSSDEEREPR